MHFSRRDQSTLLALALGPTGSIGWRDDAIAFAAFKDAESEPVAVAVFQAFTGNEAEIHFATISGGRVTAEIVAALGTLAFHPRAMNLGRVWAVIAEDNAPAQVAAIKTGFRFEFCKRGGFAGGKDAIVFSMMRAGTHQAAAKRHDNEEVT